MELTLGLPLLLSVTVSVLLIITILAGLVHFWLGGYVSQISMLKADILVWKDITKAALENLEHSINANRDNAGKPPFTPIAPVVPEHSSPVTPRQEEMAEQQTMRARLTAATLDLGLPARE